MPIAFPSPRVRCVGTRQVPWRARALAAALAAALVPAIAPAAETPSAAERRIDHGRYLVRLGGCNDCHTPGYGPAAGKVPEKNWLVGDQVGYQGPWGTTYPANLRLLVAAMSESQFLTMAKTREMRPPMPWFTLHAMTTDDLKAVYQYIHAPGPKGEPAPAYRPPGDAPAGPVVVFPMPPKASPLVSTSARP